MHPHLYTDHSDFQSKLYPTICGVSSPHSVVGFPSIPLQTTILFVWLHSFSTNEICHRHEGLCVLQEFPSVQVNGLRNFQL
jgi:hypothetical protein